MVGRRGNRARLLQSSSGAGLSRPSPLRAMTDGLHEDLMLKMPLFLNFVKIFLIISFGLAQLGAFLGIIRLCGTIGLFHLIKPSLRNFSTATLKPVLRSFYRSNHWLVMYQETSVFRRTHVELAFSAGSIGSSTSGSGAMLGDGLGVSGRRKRSKNFPLGAS